LTLCLRRDINYYTFVKNPTKQATIMSILKNNLPFFDSSFLSNVRSIILKIGNFVWATVMACLILLGGKATAANVLVNPGAETGNSTGWVFDTKASVASTNAYNYNGGISYPPTASNILSHTGAYVFKTYQDTGGALTRIYQDIAAGPNSQWSANCYALSHLQDYISAPCNAHLQVVFYDNATNALAVYGSQILDPTDLSGFGSTWTIVPPMAVDASGWLYLNVTNVFSSDPASENNYSSTTTLPLVAPAGTAFIRYQLEFDDATGGGGSVFWDDCVLNKISGSDPDVITAPTASTVVVGQNVTFTVVGSGNTALSYQWKKNSGNANGPRIGGANTATLTITNCLLSDAASYSVLITDSNGSIQTIPVTLTVLNPAAAANALGANAGFENGTWSPFTPFNGTGLPSTNSTYYQVTNLVNVYDGKYCAQIYAGGTDNGFFQTVAGVTPGSVWKAAGHAYITSTVDDFSASNTCRVQVWFKNGNGAQVGPTYESFKIFGIGYTNVYPMLPRDTWVYLPVTNIVDNTDTPTNFVQSLVAPASAASINFQVYYYHPGSTGGSVFWDDMELYQLIPTTITPSVSGNNYNITFATRGGSVYAVLYKNSLTDATWSVLSNNITGTGSTVTVSDPITRQTRFYRVQVQ
jgi:hypothetical protein